MHGALFQHAVGGEPAVMALAGLEVGAIDCVGGLEATARTSPDLLRVYCIEQMKQRWPLRPRK